MITSPYLVEDSNISEAWCRTLEHIIDCPGYEITPLIVSLTEFNEMPGFRSALDAHLQKNNKAKIHTVAETIFPESLYILNGFDRHKFYQGFLEILPRIKKIDASSNSRGTYFERLVAFDGPDGKINQLEMIITSLQDRTIKRRSKLQASIFDPTKDHSDGPYQRFPCLQHVTFYTTPNGRLIINSFYAIQYLYERAYGNWLGLINLGKFVATQIGTELERFTCFIGVEKLDSLKKWEGQEFLNTIAKKNNV
jgi:thymidylate synthase